MLRIKVGSFVRYKYKNELGVVKEVTEHGARVWYHSGGTSNMSPFHIIEVIDVTEAKHSKFSNDHQKASLFERRQRLIEGGDVSDLIDDKDIRKESLDEFPRR